MTRSRWLSAILPLVGAADTGHCGRHGQQRSGQRPISVSGVFPIRKSVRRQCDSRSRSTGPTAAGFLRERGLSDDRVNTVWQTIALRTSVGLANRFGPEQSAAFKGISLDVTGSDRRLLSPAFIDRVHAAWPRHDLGYAIADLIARDIRGNSMKAPPFSFPGHLNELINGSSMSFFGVVGNSGRGERPMQGAAS